MWIFLDQAKLRSAADKEIDLSGITRETKDE
jgi:hypothetical protein